jgi:hypothetical protein
MARRILLVLLVVGFAGLAQRYAGPKPAKKDVPYLLQASKLIETEAVEARQEGKKDDVTYAIAGASSPVTTPMAEPIFIMQAEKIAPERFELHKLESKGGRRELQIKRAHAIQLDVTRLSADGLWKLEVDESLEPGEYSLSPKDSNLAFCFEER